LNTKTTILRIPQNAHLLCYPVVCSLLIPADLATPANNRAIFLRRFRDAGHRSYCVGIPIQSSGLAPRAAESRSPISAEISAAPFSSRDNVTRVTSRCMPGGLKPLSDSPGSPPTRRLRLQRLAPAKRKCRESLMIWRPRRESNPQPSDPKSDALSN
jgi:hypothetical protein